MRYPVTIVMTLIALALCLYNYTGYDPHNFIFFMFSPPAWVADLLVDIHEASVLLLYALTLITYALIGYVADRLIRRGRNNNRAPA